MLIIIKTIKKKNNNFKNTNFIISLVLAYINILISIIIIIFIIIF